MNSGTAEQEQNGVTIPSEAASTLPTPRRLPDSKELESLVEHCRVSPAINQEIFLNALSSYVWSGSPLASDAWGGWGVLFNNGNVHSSVRFSDYHFVRLVRGGEWCGACPACVRLCRAVPGLASLPARQAGHAQGPAV